MSVQSYNVIKKYELCTEKIAMKNKHAGAGSLDPQNLQHITENMHEGLVVHDNSGKIIYFNPAALQILGLSEDQLLGRTSMDLNLKSIKEDGSPFEGKDHPAMEALATGKKITNVLMGLTLPSGEERWIRINAVPVKREGARQVIVMFSNVTSQMSASKDILHIFSHSMDLLCIANIDGTFKRVSPSFTKILGWTEQELLARPFADYIHPDDLEATAKVVAKLHEGIPLANFENRYRTKSGSYRLLNWVCEPDATTGMLYATGRDVTELRAVENKNKQILNAIDESAIVAFTDVNGLITNVNDNFCKISGYEKHELIGKSHRVVNSGKHPKAFFKDMWQTIKAGKKWTGDIENKAKNGSTYNVRTVIAPIKNINGEVDQYMAIRFDVTEQKKIEKQLVEAQGLAKIGNWQFDLNTGALSWSSEHYKIFEIEEPQAQEELYKKYRERIYPEDLQKLDILVERATLYGEGFTYNHRVVLDNGLRIKHVQGIGHATKDASGKTVLLSGTCQDLTDIISLQEQNRFILDSMGIGVWKFNPNTQDLHWDKSMYALYELNEKDFSGHYQAWESSLSPEAKEKAVFELQQAVSGKKEFNTTFEIVTKSGARKHIGARGSVVRNEKGEPIMMYGINWDRSNDVKMEAALEHERAIAVHTSKLASLGEMSAGIAHEINNPLAIISGNLAVLERFKDDKVKYNNKIETMAKAATRIEKIVKGLKKFARTTENSEFKNESISHMISEVLVLAEAKIKKSGTIIEVDVAPDIEILCDGVEIEQVLLNLVNNGIDAINQLANKWIKIKALREGEQIVLQVIDSGVGIPLDIEGKLFQPFFTTKEVGSGTGLGLSIAKGILDQHSATITVNRKMPNTCFEIRFAAPKSASQKVLRAS